MARTHASDLERDSSQYLSVADNASLSITGDITGEAYIMLESLPAGVAYAIMGKDLDAGNQRSWRFTYYDSGAGVYKLDLVTSSNGTNQDADGGVAYTFSTGVWYHVSFSKTGSVATFYVDAVKIGTKTGMNATIFDSTAPFYVGAANAQRFFDGKIREVRLFNDVRTQQEIVDDAMSENVTDANLKGEWLLNNSYADSSGNGSTLSGTGSPTFASITLKPIRTLVVAGGGGGGTGAGTGAGGGGGAGGVKDAVISGDNASYTITVGTGGNAGSSGNNSSFDTRVSSTGGGAGGNVSSAGSSGGSGGGGGWTSGTTQSGGTGSTGQGSNGGTSSTNGVGDAAGGGGGASAVGSNGSTNTGGAGGAGMSSDISGSSVTYGGGGAGGSWSGSGASSGGSGGGGAGGGSGSSAVAGTANTGGGGGGGCDSPGDTAGAAGGSGVVIVRYLTSDFSGAGGVKTTDGLYTVHTFNSSGTLTLSSPSSGNAFFMGANF